MTNKLKSKIKKAKKVFKKQAKNWFLAAWEWFQPKLKFLCGKTCDLMSGLTKKTRKTKVYSWFGKRVKKFFRLIKKITQKIASLPFVEKTLDYMGKLMRKYRWTRRISQFFSDIKDFFIPPAGSLSWQHLFKIAFKNLLHGRSRATITIGGVAVGIGAIVLLVSFGYGLQDIVTKKIIWEKALRVTEVTSESSSVKLNKETLGRVENVKNVEQVAPSVRLAGQVVFQGSKTDVVVVGVTNDYLELSNLQLIKGDKFSQSADQRFLGKINLNELEAVEIDEASDSGQVAGVEVITDQIEPGDLVREKPVWIRVRDGAYITAYSEPKTTGSQAGFVKGSIIKTYKADLVWGGIYDDLSGAGRNLTPDNQMMGKWLKLEMPLYQKLDDGSYLEQTDEVENQVRQTVYLPFNDVRVLTDTEIKIENMLGNVLGDATPSAEASSSATATDSASLAASLDEGSLAVGTQSASLETLLTEDQTSGDQQTTYSLKVWDNNEKQVLISDSLLRAWNKTIDEVVGQDLETQYLVTSTLLSSVPGRLLSETTRYKIVGVFSEEAKPLIYVPLGDIESMGIENYSSARVLAASDESLGEVRTLIQSLGLVTRSVVDTLLQINRLFRIIRFLLGAFGAIGLLVALFGMFNTLTVSLLERTREIGVMKSLGTTNTDVSRLFLTEAVLISFFGGLVGILGGSLLAQIIERLVFHSSVKAGQNLFILPWDFALLILLLATLVGVVTGYYPAKRASKISALNALRYE